MTVAEPMVKLGLGKDKLESSKSEDKGVCEKNHKEDDDGNGNGKALRLGSSARGVEAKEAESEKKPVECFLYHGLHRLRKCSKKFIIEGDDGADKKPKKLGLSKEKVEAKRAKRSKKEVTNVRLLSNLRENVTMKIVKLGPMRLNLSKATELAESSTKLSPMEEVSLTSDLEEEATMQTLKLGSMRLISIDTSEELPPLKIWVVHQTSRKW
ncbi:hypothetical protein J1N35_040108 [Gossypium stocksii]|uniref:Uncharacterized protein n=1 Tax=Gossypium stocksii TaxID=47602 RepID=A0A9D3ZHE7_9ROSI|nr:hypothetical protein J1N35_040108 [Gossypium stocksii]